MFPLPPPVASQTLENEVMFLYVACLVLGWLVLRSIYRLWLHPLRGIPGPRLAAITHLYELYFDAIKGGRYIWEIEKMHAKYGPVVRINPREVHIKDSDVFNLIYAGREGEKDPKLFLLNVIPTSLLATTDHDHHKVRRHIVDRVFSKKSIAKIDGMIQDKVEILLKRLDQARLSGAVVDLYCAFAALAADVISEYMYGESLGYLHAEEYQNLIADAAIHTVGWLHYVRFFPSLFNLLQLIPTGLLQRDQSMLGPFFRLFQLTRDKSNEYLADAGSAEGGKKKKTTTTTILSAMVADHVTPQEKSSERLVAEPVVFLVAGTDTTARASSVALFHLARNPSILMALRKELFQSFPLAGDKTAWSQQGISASKLERLPYLTAVVRESLRIAHPAIFRSSRLAAQPMMYKDVVIPAGTPISQSIYFVSMDPVIFPSPETFNPDRWIEAAANGVNLTKYLVTFGSGSRACVGMHLAYAELYHAIAAVTCAFHWELHETGPEDVRTTRDLHLATPESGCLSVKTLITGKVA